MTRLLVGLALLGALGILAAELLLRPPPVERLQLAGLLGGVTVLSMLVATGLRHLSRRSLAVGVLATAVVAVAIAGVAVSAAAGAMFLNDHDLRLVLVALGLGVGTGIALAVGLVRPLVRDLDRVGATARAVALGDRGARTGVERADELGATAAALDDLATALERAERERTAVEDARARFLAAVGHDLRSPLTVLRTGIEALEDEVATDVPALLRRLRGETELLGSLVDDLFLLARIESHGLQLTVERVDLAELADGAAEAVALVAADRQVQLRVRTPDGAPVDADPRELTRVLRNLLDNAIRHTPPGTTVTITVDAHDEVVVTVTDEGPGFPADAAGIAELFASFVRGDDARVRDGGGAGLGLAIADGLVRAHGGSIHARPGPGGHVAVHLPRAA